MWNLFLVDSQGKKAFIETFRTKRIALINSVNLEMYLEEKGYGNKGLTTLVEKRG